ncbi:hypothetical protein CN326_23270 [Bacillus sp. AFS018417]|uniref:hypothetical protein n=1 Tax=Bacillus sp. AFS018417 TaxID=2033491 RepID=UPI000BF2F736|nr:hypothetical protein [Bacillus sp. AFS018417]PEY99551.1 hypothetical protein CN326_23270 [Bacillus sp. AFS018417]PGZ94916.1 hypothetical protein COE51_21965 [Bacillus pseudomycoides]
MAFESLPTWFWSVYYIFLLLAFVTALYSLFKKKEKWLSASVVLTTLLVPFVSLLYSIGRPEGKNEAEHLIDELKRGEPWSILVIVGYMLILFWFIRPLINKGNQLKNSEM